VSFASSVVQPVGTALGTALAERVIAPPPPPRAASELELLREEHERLDASARLYSAVPHYVAAIVGGVSGFLLFTALAPAPAPKISRSGDGPR